MGKLEFELVGAIIAATRSGWQEVLPIVVSPDNESLDTKLM